LLIATSSQITTVTSSQLAAEMTRANIINCDN